MNIFCVGLSHHTAPVETRELFAGEAAVDRMLCENAGCAEALLLATCNRVELYAVAPCELATRQIAQALARPEFHLADSHLETFYRHEGEACARHLFRVTSGLDSMVVGETEILGQTKKAYAIARAAGSAGRYLHRLFQRAFRVAKQVRTRTDITRGSVSVGSIAVDLAEQIFGDLTKRKVLLLGAGEISERTARTLLGRGVRDIRIANRTAERSERLAAEIDARSLPFENWREESQDIDILIASTAASDFLLTREMLEPMLAGRRNQPLFAIDLAVPRNISPDVNDIEGVYLYDIDSLRSLAERSIAARRQQIAVGEAIIAEHVAAVSEWLRGQTPERRAPAVLPISTPGIDAQQA
jgi:glutamyl-tRNA reductase